MSNFSVDIEKQLSSLGRELQQFLDKVVPHNRDEGDFTPACDVVESASAYKIMADLPGMKKKDVKITLKGRVLTVEGVRELYLEDDERLELSERKQGGFIRSFTIPETADADQISASFKDGVLKIDIQKSEIDDEESADTIPIN